MPPHHDEFIFGNVTDYAKDKGVEFVFYKRNERTELLAVLSEGLGGDQEKAQVILRQRINENQDLTSDRTKSKRP